MSAAAVAAIGCLAVLAAPTAALASPCPNEPLRLGPSALLPGCRAYEMVSPVDKSRGVISNFFNNFTSPNGESVSFSSIAAFAGAPSANLDTAYIGRRGGSNWSTESVDPPYTNLDEGPVNYLSPVNSPDLTKTLEFSPEALAPGAIQGGSNVYIRDNLTGTRRLLVALPGRKFFNLITSYEPFYLSGNADWSNMLFVSTFPLTGETPEGVRHLYAYRDGRLELVDRLPEEASSGESPIATKGTLVVETQTANAHVMSTDGSRVFFTLAQPTEPGEAAQPGAGTLFMRETRNGVSRTVPISTIQIPGPDKGKLAEGFFGAASADGSVVYFTSGQELTPGGNSNGTPAIYRYDVPDEELTDVTPSASAPQVQKVLGVGDDGSDLYFTSGAELGADPVANPAATNMYVLNASDEIRLIGTIGGNEFNNPHQWLTSRNGRYFVFTSVALLTGDAHPGTETGCPLNNFLGNQAGECFEVYRFDAVADHLECVSCTGGTPTGNSFIGGLSTRHEREIFGLRAPEAVLDDGTVYVETVNALLPGDVNEVRDVYAVDGGAKELISSGTSTQPSYFGDATLTGSNVFFLTAQQLVKADVDGSVDLYDDREGGGLQDQWPQGEARPCEGEGCRGEAPGAPTPLAAGSAGAGEGCDALIVNSERASARAAASTRKWREATHWKGASAKKRARRLRHQARTQGLKAKRIEKQAKLCRRQGK